MQNEMKFKLKKHLTTDEHRYTPIIITFGNEAENRDIFNFKNDGPNISFISYHPHISFSYTSNGEILVSAIPG
jgi:hypothetical protein